MFLTTGLIYPFLSTNSASSSLVLLINIGQPANVILPYLKGTAGVGLFFKPATHLNLDVFSDADWASSLDDRKSTSACLVFLGGNHITWSSRKQHVVACSSAEAEYKALAQASVEVLWLQSLFQEIGLQLSQIPVIV